MTLRDALAAAARQLEGSSDTPRLDAELLMAHALGVSREAMILAGLDRAAPPGFDALLARRMAREPVAYITGKRAFWTIELAVGPGVLVPRPDSETLIEGAIAHFAPRAPRTVLDLGTGSGALLLAALAQWPEASGLGIDASDAALACARANAEALGLSARADIRKGNWADGLDARFDLVLCNPPYVETSADLPPDVRDHEPESALFAGEDGLDDYRRLAPVLPRLIAPGGCALVEIGHRQAGAVSALLRGFAGDIAVLKDLAGRDRAIRISA